ncbi:MAG: UDP-N-acetylmuramoyl-tripeptide--D-alanyl-D-alanine ligase [Opitutales bacterium]|nr:UDP-N-acetylmuramoyl-tripeptide--D-alanyl-D-alanine ligase [Opitutales bacterium]
MTLGKLPDFQGWADLVYGQWTRIPEQHWIGGSLDSRTLRKGELFFAVRGEKVDGHDFVEQAWERGAVAAVVEKEQSVDLPQLVVENSIRTLQTMAAETRRCFTGKVFGVTGSCGKTTTKEILATLLRRIAPTHATEGNFNNTLGVPLTLLGLQPEHRFAVIEAGINRPGEMVLLSRLIDPDEVLLTSIAPVHLEKLGSLKNIAREKTSLGRKRGGISDLTLTSACLPYAPVKGYPGHVRVLRKQGEAVEADAEWWSGEGEIIFRYPLRQAGNTPEECYALSPLSQGMMENLVLALWIARREGLASPEAAKTLQEWRPRGNRGRVVPKAHGCWYIDCYNANPVSLRDALDFFQQVLTAKHTTPRLYLLGTMEELGEHREALHREVLAEREWQSGDTFLLFGEQAETMQKALRSKGVAAERITVNPALAEAGQRVEEFAGSVFAKGSRKYMLEKAFFTETLNKEKSC